jgi:serine/threonine protein kinase
MVLVDAIFTLVYAAISVQGNVVQNRRKTKSLVVCLEAIMPPLKTIEGSEHSIAHAKTLEKLKDVVCDAKSLLEKQCTKSYVAKLVSSSSVKWQFADVTQRLQSHMQALNLSVSVLQRMDSKKRDADDAADLDEMQREIRKMLQGNQVELQAQLAELDAGQQAKAQEMISKLTEGQQQLRKDISDDLKDIIKDISPAQQADSSLPHIDMATDLKKSTSGVDTLGAGGFGEVKKMVWATGGDIEVAVKVLLARKPSPKALLELRKEAEAMHAMRHPNVIQLYGASLKPPHLCLVLEFAPYGSLEDALQEEGSPKSTTAWRERLLVASDIIKGLKYLHSRKVLHLDIKSGNVMLFEHKSRRLAKLADFGLAFIKNETSAAGTVAVKTNAGTVNWKPPELFRKGGEATRASDVYSCACVMYELASGCIPWDGEGPANIVGYVTNGERPDKPEGCIEGFWKLISHGWAQKVKDRITTDGALKQLEGLVKMNGGGDSKPLINEISGDDSKPTPVPPQGPPHIPQPVPQVISDIVVTMQPDQNTVTTTVHADIEDDVCFELPGTTEERNYFFRGFTAVHAVFEIIFLALAADFAGKGMVLTDGNYEEEYGVYAGLSAFGSSLMLVTSCNTVFRISGYPKGRETMIRKGAFFIGALTLISFVLGVLFMTVLSFWDSNKCAEVEDCAASNGGDGYGWCRTITDGSCDQNLINTTMGFGAFCSILRVCVAGVILRTSLMPSR